MPAGLQYACFGIMMVRGGRSSFYPTQLSTTHLNNQSLLPFTKQVLEYYTLIFCRSALSIRFFPRAAALLWLAFHFYFYATPYGFFSEVSVSILFLDLKDSALPFFLRT